MQTQANPLKVFPPGAYHYGLNLFLEGTDGFIQINSKRIERNFRLTAVNSAFMYDVDGVATDWSLILGTLQTLWFADFCRAETILGDGALPHFVPEGGIVVEKGDYIVVQARNDNTTAKRIALMFQGVHI